MKTEKEIYEYLRRELGRFEPEEPEAQTEFDWCLTKISREFTESDFLRYQHSIFRIDDHGMLLQKFLGDPTETWHAIVQL